MVAKAASQIGVREGRDANGNWNNVQPYGTWYAKAIGNQAFAAVAWCDIFISWCAEFSGNADIIPKCAYVPSRLAYYRAQKRTGFFPPQPGDLIIILRNGVAQHIGLVEKWLGDAVQTIEGNTNDTGSYQGNGVYRLRRKDWSSNPDIIYCRPAYAATMSKPTPAPAPAPIPAPTPTPAPAPKEDDMPTADEIALAVMRYKNTALNGDKDVYQLLTDAAKQQAAPVVTDEQLERVLRKVVGSVDGKS
jgi:hypothetical protein